MVAHFTLLQMLILFRFRPRIHINECSTFNSWILLIFILFVAIRRKSFNHYRWWRQLWGERRGKKNCHITLGLEKSFVTIRKGISWRTQKFHFFLAQEPPRDSREGSSTLFWTKQGGRKVWLSSTRNESTSWHFYRNCNSRGKWSGAKSSTRHDTIDAVQRSRIYFIVSNG